MHCKYQLDFGSILLGYHTYSDNSPTDCYAGAQITVWEAFKAVWTYHECKAGMDIIKLPSGSITIEMLAFSPVFQYLDGHRVSIIWQTALYKRAIHHDPISVVDVCQWWQGSSLSRVMHTSDGPRSSIWHSLSGGLDATQLDRDKGSPNPPCSPILC